MKKNLLILTIPSSGRSDVLVRGLFLLTILSLGVRGLFAQKMTNQQVSQAEQDGKRKYEIVGSLSENELITKFEKVEDTTIVERGNDFENTIKELRKTTIFPETRQSSLQFKGVAMMEILGLSDQDCNWGIHTNENEQDWVSGVAQGSVEHRSETYDFNQRSEKGHIKVGISDERINDFSKNELSVQIDDRGTLNKLGIFQFCYNPQTKHWSIDLDFTDNEKGKTRIKRTGEQVDSHEANNNRTIDEYEENTSSVSFQINGGSHCPNCGCSLNYNGKIFVVKCVKNIAEKRENGQLLTRQTVASFSIQPYSNFEAIIEPDGSLEAYKKWLPEGPKPDEATETTGNFSLFKVYVKDKRNPTQRTTHSIKQIAYRLENVSHEPGYAMNFPFENPSTKADLQLCPLGGQPNPEQEKLNLTLTKNEQSDWKIAVQSFDYGAHGKLMATVTLDSGEELEASVAETGQTFMPIPFRDNLQSQVADNWKKENKVSDLADNDDDEKGEKGIGDHNGDGLSLYEEYRGFIQHKKHFRANPQKKDLMVCNMITINPERSKDGINLFRDVTHLQVHDDFQLDEFGQKCNPTVEGTSHDKVINFNSTPRTHIVNQHGIAMINSLEKKGYAQAVTKDGLDIGTPKNYKYLEITPDFSPDYYNVIEADGQSKFGKGTKVISEDYGHTVAHEMLHCCHVFHHGDRDIKQINIKLGKDIADTLNANDIYIVANAKVFNYTNLLFFEDGKQITNNLINSPNGNSAFLGLQYGQHSGYEDCIMRYRAANAYLASDDKVYIILTGAGYVEELSGIQLCDSPKGTGVNASDHKPRSRYGDAALGRGNCKHQVCINDKYH